MKRILRSLVLCTVLMLMSGCSSENESLGVLTNPVTQAEDSLVVESANAEHEMNEQLYSEVEVCLATYDYEKAYNLLIQLGAENDSKGYLSRFTVLDNVLVKKTNAVLSENKVNAGYVTFVCPVFYRKDGTVLYEGALNEFCYDKTPGEYPCLYFDATEYENGKIIKQCSLSELFAGDDIGIPVFGEIYKICENYEYDSHGNIVSYTFRTTFGGGAFYNDYVYDASGIMVANHKSRTNEEGKIDTWDYDHYEYIYDEFGRVTCMIISNMDAFAASDFSCDHKTCISKTKWEYEYDDEGRMVKETFFDYKNEAAIINTYYYGTAYAFE